MECLLDKTMPSRAHVIRYQYSDPVNLSGIEESRVLYDSNSDIQITIMISDNNNGQIIYSSPEFNTGFIYKLFSFSPNFRTLIL
jgi:hypothetical protein